MGFKALSRSSLLRILNVCAASTHKSFQGLDYISSASAEAFDDLCGVAKTLGDVGQGMGSAKEKQKRLQEGKHYLKSNYKVHMSPCSTVADHCRQFALSDPKKKASQNTCDHEYSRTCHNCNLLTSTIEGIEAALVEQRANLLPDTVKDELQFRVKQTKSAS